MISHIKRQVVAIAIAIPVMFSVLFGAWASIPLINLNAAIGRSEMIVLARIERHEVKRLDGERCRVRVVATAIEFFKNSVNPASGHVISFAGADDLVPGHDYLLFLRYVPDAEVIYEEARLRRPEITEDVPKERALNLIRCDGLIPGLASDWGSAWEIIGDEVVIENIMLVDWPTAIPRVRQPDPTVSIVSKADLFRYLRERK